jgi:hypothetical protein
MKVFEMLSNPLKSKPLLKLGSGCSTVFNIPPESLVYAAAFYASPPFRLAPYLDDSSVYSSSMFFVGLELSSNRLLEHFCCFS